MGPPITLSTDLSGGLLSAFHFFPWSKTHWLGATVSPRVVATPLFQLVLPVVDFGTGLHLPFCQQIEHADCTARLDLQKRCGGEVPRLWDRPAVRRSRISSGGLVDALQTPALLEI
jgi:hypothetical protein